ncbi:MAG: polyprenyl synthetase family protein, partial [Dehalococcoidia bacterium]
MVLPKSFDKYRPELEAGLKAAIGNRNLFLYDILRYHLGWVDQEGKPAHGSWGKGLRPLMCLWACEAVGGKWEDALPAAVALELVHNFSLIHDDIQDGDKKRHHRPTVWHIWGAAQGINAGDSMRGLATLALVEGGQSYPKEKLVAAVAGLEKACLEMIEGQYL